MSVSTRTDRAQDEVEPGPPPPDIGRRRTPIVRRWLDLTGFTLAATFYCFSLTPSLLPRAWYLQGVVSGITAATGYGVGTLVPQRLLAPRVRRVGWPLMLVLAPVAGTVFVLLGTRWQKDLRRRLGMEALDTSYTFRMVLISLATFAVLLLITRALRLSVRGMALVLGRVTPEPVAYCAGFVVVMLLTVGFVDTFLMSNLFAMADRRASVTNDGTDSDVVAPTSSVRSGGPYSLAPWTTLGRQGRDFVAEGPTRAELTAFAGRPALEPIRVYAGLQSADSPADRARLVLREMDRTGAFDRSVVAVFIPTGTGWVDGAVTNSLEYMYAGDTALVSMQYSYLPSWISFLTDRSTVAEAAEALITAVHDRWAALPAGDRPKLLIFGESLGTLGTEKTFGTVSAMVGGADGILLEGPTFANPIHAELTENRSPGSPVWNPVYPDQPVAFAARPAELRHRTGPPPKVVYLQNPTDPVVWWSPTLLYRSPDWLDRPRGPDVSPDMHWFPGITFWQTSVDMVFSNDVPRGHGHQYKSGTVDGWAALAAPPGWTVQDTLRLRALLES
ncbi:MAG TPA: alpha/beta-hydrolase family protein [Actinoplanes sp.]|nr:alpha/beta-hydrolase family protein [Actinoplanes sp.]